MPKRMVQPQINEVSGVDHPAHLTEGWLLMKSAGHDISRLRAEAEAISKGIDPDTLDDKGAVMPKTDPVTKSADDAFDFSDPASFEKAISSLPAAMREGFRKTQREAVEAKALAKALTDEREEARFEKMARELVHLPKVDGEFHKSLRAAHDADAESFEKVFEVLKAADSAIAVSGLYKEIGTGASGTAGNQSSIEAIAKELEAKDPSLSHAEAVVKAAEANPELYAAHRADQLRANATLEA